MGRNFTPEVLQALDAPFRNALAPRGGLAFAGTAGSKAQATLTGQSILTDSLSLVATTKVSNQTPFSTIAYLGPDATSHVSANTFAIRQDAGSLVVALFGATTSDNNVWSYAGFGAAYMGKIVQVAAVRGTSGNVVVWINGVDFTSSGVFVTGGTPPTWQGSVTSTYLTVGYGKTDVSYAGTIYSASLYNLALSAADVLEIYEGGGAVPERFKFGSQPTRFPTGNYLSFGAADANVAPAGNWGGTTWTGTAGARTGGAGAYYHKVAGSGWVSWVPWSLGITTAPGQGSPTWLVRFWARMNVGTSGGGLAIGLGPQGGINIVTSGTARQAIGSSWAQYSYILNAPTAKTATLGMMFFDTQFSSPWEIDIDDVEVIPLGAVVHLDGESGGVGFQWPDASTNKLHALLTTTGVSWTKSATVGYIKALSDGTLTAQVLAGGTVLPANIQITRIRARSLSGTPSITLGTAGGGATIVALVALSTAWKDLTIALPSGINTSAASLWINLNAANVVEVQVAYEQLPA